MRSRPHAVNRCKVGIYKAPPTSTVEVTASCSMPRRARTFFTGRPSSRYPQACRVRGPRSIALRREPPARSAVKEGGWKPIDGGPRVWPASHCWLFGPRHHIEHLCNRYGNRVTYNQYVRDLAAFGLPLVSPPPDRAPNLEPVDDIRPTNTAPVLRPMPGVLELTSMRWGLIPWFHKGDPKTWKPLTTNCRGETAAITPTFKGAYARRRCLIPASHYFEWTGPKGKKVKWRFTRPGAEWFCFAGVWDRADIGAGAIESFTILTATASAYVKRYHDRQPVVLEPSEFASWLDPANVASALFDPATRSPIVVELAEVSV